MPETPSLNSSRALIRRDGAQNSRPTNPLQNADHLSNSSELSSTELARNSKPDEKPLQKRHILHRSPSQKRLYPVISFEPWDKFVKKGEKFHLFTSSGKVTKEKSPSETRYSGSPWGFRNMVRKVGEASSTGAYDCVLNLVWSKQQGTFAHLHKRHRKSSTSRDWPQIKQALQEDIVELKTQGAVSALVTGGHTMDAASEEMASDSIQAMQEAGLKPSRLSGNKNESGMAAILNASKNKIYLHSSGHGMKSLETPEHIQRTIKHIDISPGVLVKMPTGLYTSDEINSLNQKRS